MIISEISRLVDLQVKLAKTVVTGLAPTVQKSAIIIFLLRFNLQINFIMMSCPLDLTDVFCLHF
jgi:hypothetical protein